MQMNNPYQQQNNFQYAPGYNAYQYNPWANVQRMQEQPQIQQQPPCINGKIVQDANSIVANDVPMDGSVALFPKSDLSEIYAKQWASDGKISTVVFKPIQNACADNSSQNEQNVKFGLSDDATTALDKKMDELLEKIEQLEKNIEKTSSTRSRSTVKKDGDA